jgi:hypothetical protein
MAHDDARVPYDVAVERAVDVGLRRACYGALAGGASAFIFLRGPRARRRARLRRRRRRRQRVRGRAARVRERRVSVARSRDATETRRSAELEIRRFG